MTLFRDIHREEEPPRWRTRRFIITAATIAGLLLIFLFWRACHKAPADSAAEIEVSVRVAKAERGTIANEITTVATLAARREAIISPRVAAPIAQMSLLTNRPVRAGEVLAVLESRDLTAQRAEAAAALTEAETNVHITANGSVAITNATDSKAVRDARANFDNATKTFERRKVLFDQGGISKKDLEASQLAVVQAETDLHLAETSGTAHRGVTNPGDIRVGRCGSAERE